jgi:hypothetical protein
VLRAIVAGDRGDEQPTADMHGRGGMDPILQKAEIRRLHSTPAMRQDDEGTGYREPSFWLT